MAVTGQCLCGQITYELKAAPTITGVCHCKNCQRQAGSAFSTLAAVAVSDFKFTAGQPKLYRDSDTDSGNRVKRYFCDHCGSPLYSAVSSKPDTVYLKAGTLDDTSGFIPQFNVWCDSKQDWVILDEGVPNMAKQS
ncbi:GFA family protein [Oceanicoccus sagamiensis]|uniref:Aldehyde-activating protein n=1 Tax=Oceanicoccus sagamiensis TaxID=716816 RepID=A0A1X9NGF1_9GAMM|nr:GFA family protein [Oceanicoccus sagamiensis]ARN73093.1 aldehyde-activating protein [Oceanicoccus sagamiensis]